MAENASTHTPGEHVAVLVDVGCDWPEVVFVRDRSEAASIARTIPDEFAVSIQSVVAFDSASDGTRGAGTLPAPL